MGLLFSSCSDWLDVTPVDTRTTENFYTTPSQMEQALIGVYNGLLPLSTYALLMSEVRSDNTWCGELSTAQRDYMDISSFNPNISTIATVRDAWNDLFEIVSRANLFLSKVDGVNYTIEGIKEQQIGEARFLRALAYFDLVRYYGRVPLTLVPQTISEAMSTPQSEAVEIYEKVIIPDHFRAANPCFGICCRKPDGGTEGLSRKEIRQWPCNIDCGKGIVRKSLSDNGGISSV